MSDTKTASQQLDEAIKAAEAAAQKVEELKKATREEDLKNVLALISRHGFTQTDLKSALKVRGASAKATTVAKRPYVRKKK
jgi:SOS response regulatory protein OraA/RecX